MRQLRLHFWRTAAPLAVGAVRIVIGGAILFALAAARGQLWRHWPALPAVASAAAVAVRSEEHV